MTKWNS